jgi:hypothetical protein
MHSQRPVGVSHEKLGGFQRDDRLMGWLQSPVLRVPEPVLLRQRDSSFYDHPATGVKQQERDVVDDLWNDAFGDEDPLLNIWQALGMFWMKFPVFHERAQGEIYMYGLFTP